MIQTEPLNLQAIALEEAETKIRIACKRGYFSRRDKSAIDRSVFPIIAEALKKIKNEVLREESRRSLLRFYSRQYNELKRSFDLQIAVFTALCVLNGRKPTGESLNPTTAEKHKAIDILEGAGYDRSRLLGSPLQKFTDEYMRENVKPAFERLARQQPLDPQDVSGHNTLRNKAEMSVRYQRHLDQIDDFRARGVNLVICSTHADCSKRCARYQGRVYSLDGTSGVTDDGRKYRPLEEATQNPEDFHYGYQNGLFGFNCRHFLVPYEKGYRFPKPNPAVERAQYAITEKQRHLERQVRKWRTIAVTNKGQDPKAFSKARKKAIEANKRYIEFSKQHNRPYYPWRVKIL